MDKLPIENYNLRSPSVKRILKEAMELKEPTYDYFAQPLEDNIYEWHFTVRGAAESDFSNGYYHGRILLPSEYPMKPPSIILLTPNGRFELNKKICLSISGYHPETWMPSWSIRTVLLAIISFMPISTENHIGSLTYTRKERQHLAKKSHFWKCQKCGQIKNQLKSKPDPVTDELKANESENKIQFTMEDKKENNFNDESNAQSTSITDTSTSVDNLNNEQPIGEPQPENNFQTSIIFISLLFLIVFLLFRRLMLYVYKENEN